MAKVFLFLKKLAVKRYPVVKCASVLNSHTFDLQQSLLKPKDRSTTKHVVPFKVKGLQRSQAKAVQGCVINPEIP